MRWLCLLGVVLAGIWLALFATLFFSGVAQAQPVTIVTAVDISNSVYPKEIQLQAEGLAEGITDERFLAVMGDGVGFEVFGWSSGGDFRTIVPYTVLRTPADASAAAALVLQTMPGIQEGRPQYPPSLAPGARYSGKYLTAMGDALSYALGLAMRAHTPRAVINILTDGVSNHGVRPEIVRDRIAAQGITVNAVIFGEAYNNVSYFQNNVVTGPGAFVARALLPEDLREILARKFWQDMIAGVR